MPLRLPARAALARLALAGPAALALSCITASAETASWYGPDFHGRTTASGERFDERALTAAYRVLPFGTRLRVTCAATGRSVVVRINDRGPYVAGRAIDLSRAAARAIGLPGVGRVRLARLG